jgi:polysaccharide chain length determinant protein (PEP-CTERM system associated)
MQKNIQVALPTRKDEAKGHFTITYTGDDPNVVTTVTNRLASLFIEENLKIREQQAVGTTEFLTNELTSAKTKLDQMETAVTQYKRRYMGELPEQRDTNIKILEQLQNQYQRVGESIRSAQDRKLFIQKQLSDMETPGGAGSLGSATYGKDIRTTPGKTSYLDMTPSSRPGETGGGYYESQREALTKTLDELTAKYTSSHPDVIATKKKLAELKNKKDKDPELYDIKKDPRYRELQNQLTLTDMEIKRLSEEERGLVAQMNRYRGRIELTPAREQDMASLMREYESTKATYETLLKKSQEAQQAENLEKRQKGEQFRVIDPARVPEKPFSPDIPKILLIGLAAGLGCGFGLAFLREQMDRSFHEPGDAEIALGLKVLATIPKIEEITA